MADVISKPGARRAVAAVAHTDSQGPDITRPAGGWNRRVPTTSARSFDGAADGGPASEHRMGGSTTVRSGLHKERCVRRSCRVARGSPACAREVCKDRAPAFEVVRVRAAMLRRGRRCGAYGRDAGDDRVGRRHREPANQGYCARSYVSLSARARASVAQWEACLDRLIEKIGTRPLSSLIEYASAIGGTENPSRRERSRAQATESSIVARARRRCTDIVRFMSTRIRKPASPCNLALRSWRRMADGASN
jgi:hypothetical protein